MSRLGPMLAAIASAFFLVAVAAAQPAPKAPRVGWLAQTNRAGSADILVGFAQELRRLGYEEGKTILIEYRFADGRTELLSGFAAELVNVGVDLIIASSTPASFAAKEATRTIPIVLAGVGNPDQSGLVASLARPGGNVTGVASAYGDFAGKWVELLAELVPRGSAIGYLFNSANADIRLRSAQLVASGRAVGVTVQSFAVKTADDVEPQLAAMGKARIRAAVIDSDAVLRARRSATVEYFTRTRIPAMYAARDYVDAGGLMSYGPSRQEIGRRSALYVDRILRGARPADLPVEQPTKFELVVSLKAATAIGLTIPPSLLQRADDVVQ